MNSKSPVTDEIKIEYWDLKKLIPYANNAKIHSEKQVKALAAIIEKNGFRNPISIDENGVIIAGHGRRLAMLHLQKKYKKDKKYQTVPVIVQRGLTEAQKDAARISDNKIGSNEYDIDLLNNEVIRLVEMGEFDLENFGMDEEEINKIIEGISLESLNIDDSGIDVSDQKTEPSQEQKMPKEIEYKPSWQVVAVCSGESEQRDVYELLKSHGYQCSIQTM